MGMFGADPQPFQPIDPAALAQINQTANAPARHGMFGGGVGRFLANFATNYAANMGQPGALEAIKGQHEQQLYQQKLAMEQAQEANKFGDWRRQYDYEVANPKPANNDTANDYAFWQSKLSPEQFQQWIQKQYDPDVSIPLPDGRMYVGPRSGMAGALSGQGGPPSKPVGKLTIINGGPTLGASGTFHN